MLAFYKRYQLFNGITVLLEESVLRLDFTSPIRIFLKNEFERLNLQTLLLVQMYYCALSVVQDRAHIVLSNTQRLTEKIP